jgi:hypothetical protein
VESIAWDIGEFLGANYRQEWDQPPEADQFRLRVRRYRQLHFLMELSFDGSLDNA